MSIRRSHSMEYEDPSDSSGTDDDLPPTHSAGRASRGVRVSGNGRAATGVIYASTQPASTGGMDHIIRKLELDAYTAVLRAFIAQSETITWDKERLMTDLRKELRVTDDHHRESLGKATEDETIRQIQQIGTGNVPAIEITPSPAVSQSRKKQKTALLPQAPLLPPPPSTTPPLPPQSKATPVQSSSGTKRGAPPGPRGKKPKGGRLPAAAKAPGGNKVGRPPSKAVENPPEVDPYIGRRVKTRWPQDNTFYEAVITDYSAETGKHALVYDMDTENETWEWITLKDIAPGDLVWVQGANVVVGRKVPPSTTTKGGIGRGMKRGPKGSVASSPGGGRAKNSSKGSGMRWQSPASENGSRAVQLMAIEDLAKEVEKLEEEEDLAKLENAKKAVRAHEEVLRKALAEVGESSDEAESAGQPPSSHTQSVDHEREHRSGQNSRDSDEDETAGNERAEHSDGEHTVGEGGNASEASEDHGDDKDEDG